MKKQRVPPARRILALIGAAVLLLAVMILPISAEEPQGYEAWTQVPQYVGWLWFADSYMNRYSEQLPDMLYAFNVGDYYNGLRGAVNSTSDYFAVLYGGTEMWHELNSWYNGSYLESDFPLEPKRYYLGTGWSGYFSDFTASNPRSAMYGEWYIEVLPSPIQTNNDDYYLNWQITLSCSGKELPDGSQHWDGLIWNFVVTYKSSRTFTTLSTNLIAFNWTYDLEAVYFENQEGKIFSQFDDYDLCFWFALDLPTTIKSGYTLTNPQQLMTAFMQQTDIDKMITYLDEWQAGYNDGYYYGYGDAYNEAEAAHANDFANGRDVGYTEALSAKGTFKELVFGIFDAPVRFINSMLNFEIFDINLLGLVKTLLTMAIVALIVFWAFKLAK